MATHSSILALKIPWTEEPGGLYNPWGHKEWDMTERLSSHTCGPPVGLGPYQMLWETPRLKVTIPDPQEIKDLKSY